MLTIPNLVTLIRLVLAPFVAMAILNSAYPLAIGLFFTAGITDIIDGALARKMDDTSLFGAYLDPIADKILLSVIYLALALVHDIPWWMLGVVFGRDLLILGMAAYGLLFTSIRKFPPSVWGKISTFFQISAAHLSSDSYDILAKAGAPVSVSQLRMMLQELVAKRFKLALHRETKMLPVYELVVAKGGPKLRDPKEEESFNSALAGKSPFRPGFASVFSNKSLPEFAERLGRPMDRPILDKTGIQGRYWFQLEWADEPGQTGRQYLLVGTNLLTALQEQLGLTLEGGTAMVEILIIDSAEKPLGN